VLNVDGTTYGQSYSIAKFVAKLGGLHKADPIEALRVEMSVDTSDDIRSKYFTDGATTTHESCRIWCVYFEAWGAGFVVPRALPAIALQSKL
jgi:hypothetical protein